MLDTSCGSGGFLLHALDKVRKQADEYFKPGTDKHHRHWHDFAQHNLYGIEINEQIARTAKMNMIIHDMEGEIQIGDTFRNPKFRQRNRLQTFDRVVANPMWNQSEFTEKDYDADELGRFPKGAGFPGNKADWGWVQHILASLKESGRVAAQIWANSNRRRQSRHVSRCTS